MIQRLFVLASLVWPLVAQPAFARDSQAAGAASHAHTAGGATSGHAHGASSKPAASKHPAPKADKPARRHASDANKRANTKGHQHDRGGARPY